MELYGQLSGDYDDRVINSVHPVQKAGKPCKEKGTLGLSEEEGLQDLCKDPLRDPGTDHEPAGTPGPESIFSGIQRREKTDRI